MLNTIVYPSINKYLSNDNCNLAFMSLSLYKFIANCCKEVFKCEHDTYKYFVSNCVYYVFIKINQINDKWNITFLFFCFWFCLDGWLLNIIAVAAKIFTHVVFHHKLDEGTRGWIKLFWTRICRICRIKWVLIMSMRQTKSSLRTITNSLLNKISD